MIKRDKIKNKGRSLFFFMSLISVIFYALMQGSLVVMADHCLEYSDPETECECTLSGNPCDETCCSAESCYSGGDPSTHEVVKFPAGWMFSTEAPDEECGNGRDDNCDGDVDEGCCSPDCSGRSCGESDGCGGSCGDECDSGCSGHSCSGLSCGEYSLCGDLCTSCGSAAGNYCSDPSYLQVGNNWGCHWSVIAYQCRYQSYTSTFCSYGCSNNACNSCTPNCVNKNCGDDGCSGSCGTCTSPNTCGGGGTAGVCGCTPSWSCSAWSPDPCPASGTQSRVCTDSNSCGTTSGKPPESQSCAPNCPSVLGSCGSSTSSCQQTCGGTTYYCSDNGGWAWRTIGELACDEQCKSVTYPSGCAVVGSHSPPTATCYQSTLGWKWNDEPIPPEICGNDKDDNCNGILDSSEPICSQQFQKLVSLSLSLSDVIEVDLDTGLDVVLIAPGGTYSAGGTLEYGPGFPSGLPAMGIGGPNLGYIPSNYPFTCTASGGQNAIGSGNSDGSKICEINFNNQNTDVAIGTASYYIHADTNAPPGEYVFGLTSNYGSQHKESDFIIKIASPCPAASQGTANAGCKPSIPGNSQDVSSSYYCTSGKCYQCNSGYVWDGANCVLCDSYCRNNAFGSCTSSTTCAGQFCSCNSQTYYCRAPYGWILPGDSAIACPKNNAYCDIVQCGGSTFTCLSGGAYYATTCTTSCNTATGVCCGGENEVCCGGGSCGSGKWCTSANMCCQDGRVWNSNFNLCQQYEECTPNTPTGNIGPNQYCDSSKVCCPNIVQTGPSTFKSNCVTKSAYISTY